MKKTKEELNTLKQEYEILNNKELQSTDECVELKEDQLEKVAGGKIRCPEQRDVN